MMKIRWKLYRDENEPVTRQRGIRVYERLQQRGIDAGPYVDGETADVIVWQYDPRGSSSVRGKCHYFVMDIADAYFLPHHPTSSVFINDVVSNFDWVFCCSPRMQSHIERWFDPRCITYFPEAIDTNYLSIKLKPSGTNKMIWMGMHDNAAFFAAVDGALKRLADDGKKFEVVFVHPDQNGAGGSNAALVRSKPYPSRHVTWTFDALKKEMSTADIALCPLFQNEWCRCKAPNKAATFAALGIPTVATDIPSYAEFIEHGKSGYLCFGPDDWYEPLNALVGDEKHQRKIGAAGKKSALSLYNIDRVCDIVEEAFGRMMV